MNLCSAAKYLCNLGISLSRSAVFLPLSSLSLSLVQRETIAHLAQLDRVAAAADSSVGGSSVFSVHSHELAHTA